MTTTDLRTQLATLQAEYDTRLDDENADRQKLLEQLLDRLYDLARDTTPSTQDNNKREDDADTIKRVEDVLRNLVDGFYAGCKTYNRAPQPDSPQRVFWRIRLGVMSDIGNQLATALRIAAPDWQAMKELASNDREARP